MKTLEELSGVPRRQKEDGRTFVSNYDTEVIRKVGKNSVDKTIHADSRPGKKLVARNANRTIQKKGRQRLKKQLKEEVEEIE